MADTNHTPLPDKHLNPVPPPMPPPPKPPASFSPSPEAGPIRMEQPIMPEPAAEELPLQEAQEHEIQDQDVQQFVQLKQDTIKLPQELKNVGLKAVNQTSFPNYQNVKLPLPDDQVMQGSKAPLNSSIRWLAEYAKLLLWRAHITLKTVQGKVIRVVKR